MTKFWILKLAGCFYSTMTSYIYIFIFMHLADAFIQSDLHCIQVTVFTFYQPLLSLGIEPMILALLAPCSTIWATGKPFMSKDQRNFGFSVHDPLKEQSNEKMRWSHKRRIILDK